MNKTIKQNSRFFKKINNVPKSAMTMGISTILSSNQIILLAFGKNKAKAIKHLINYPISNNYPVSFLKNHKHLIVILDKSAASLLTKTKII